MKPHQPINTSEQIQTAPNSLNDTYGTLLSLVSVPSEIKDFIVARNRTHVDQTSHDQTPLTIDSRNAREALAVHDLGTRATKFTLNSQS